MTVSRIRRTQSGTDAYGDPVWTEDTATLTGAYTFPRTSGDVTGVGRDGVVVGLTLHAPHGSDLRRADQIEDTRYRDDDGGVERWKILGEVADWARGGRRPPLVVSLERAEG